LKSHHILFKDEGKMDNDQNNQQLTSPTPSVATAYILLLMQFFMIVAPPSIGIATILISRHGSKQLLHIA